jgi:hypothetical protein
MKLISISLSLALAGATLASQAAPVIFSAAGANAAGIQTTVDAYRASLGALNPNVAGSLGGGRREINWDGVPDLLSAPNNLPANFFNSNSPRGVVFATPGTGFQVSANAAAGPIEFGNLNPTYPDLFSTFSPQRLFTALGSNVVDVDFFVPGSTTRAGVSGFGAVFTDVDLANVTSLAFFGLGNEFLGTFFATEFAGNASLSFLGVQFNAGERIGRVRVTSGNAALGPNEGGGIDLVVMDDFIFAEPIAAAALPEPSSLALVLLPLLGLAYARRRSPV